MIKHIANRLISLLLAFLLILGIFPDIVIHSAAEDLTPSGTLSNVPGDDFGELKSDSAANNVSAGKGSVSINKNVITISATGSAASGCNAASSSATTWTLRNDHATAATVTYTFTKTSGEGTISPASGSVTIPAGGTTSFQVTSAEAAATTKGSLTLTGVTFAVAPCTTTFLAPTNGSYSGTCNDGWEVIPGQSHTANSNYYYQLTAVPDAGYSFSAWIDGNGTVLSYSNPCQITSADRTIAARFVPTGAAVYYIKGKPATEYFYLDQAISAAGSSGTVVVKENGKVLGSSGQTSFTIPSGVTLLVPFDAAATVYTTAPDVLYGTHTTPSAYRTLTIASGTSITVANGGKLCVPSKLSATGTGSGSWNGSPTGAGGRIVMNGDSSITVQSGGGLYCYGYISGSGSVTAQSGATIYEAMQFRCWRGGTATTGMTSGVFPMNQYYIQNIEVPLTLYSGASEYIYTSVNMSSKAYPTSTRVIGSDAGMFRLTSGYMVKSYDGARDYLNIDIYGDMSLSSLSLSLAGASANTKDYNDLPITNNMSIHVHSGTLSVPSNQSLAFLAGTELSVDQNAAMTIASNVYVYDQDDWGQDYFAAPKCYVVPVGYSTVNGTTTKRATTTKPVDAKIDINGTVTVTGKLYTTAAGANIISSEGTGKIVLSAAPTASTTTQQATQSGTDITRVTINCTAAQLHNGANRPSGAEEYTPTAGAASGDVFGYAKLLDMWIKNPITLTFDANGGEGTMQPQMIPKNADSVLQANTFTREGYNFLGWSTNAGDETAAYTDGATVKLSADTKLYAIWENAATYTITWLNGDGTVLQTDTLSHGAMPAYTGDTPTKAYDETGHYTFSGWDPTPAPATADTVYQSQFTVEAHSFTEEIITPAACTTNGELKRSCSCGYTETQVIPMLGHDLVHHEAKAATCTEAGWNAYDTCARCDYTTYEELPALGHDFGEWTHDENSDPSTHSRTCSRCDVTETEACSFADHVCTVCGYSDLPPKTVTVYVVDETRGEHLYLWAWGTKTMEEAWPGKELTSEGTDKGGNPYYSVTLSNADYTELLFNHGSNQSQTKDLDYLTDADENDYVVYYLYEENGLKVSAGTDLWPESSAVRVEPSCTEKGSITYTGLLTGAKETVELEALGHDWSGEYVQTTAPTCTEPGVETLTCKRCDATQTREIAALDHDWSGEYVQTTAPTCTEPGVETLTCKRCDATQTREIAALGHDYVSAVTEPTCTEQGYTTHTCSRCDDRYVDSYVGALGHDFGEWTVTTEPSCTEKGTETRICARCDAKETREIEALGHDWDEGVVTTEPTLTKEGEKTFTCKRCGETKTEPIEKLPAVDTTALEAAIAAAKAVNRNDYTAESLAIMDEALAAAEAALASDTLTQAEADEKTNALLNATANLVAKDAVPMDVYFVDETGLDNVYYYTFNKASDTPKTAWPGEALAPIGVDRNGKNVYKISIDTSRFDNVIFNNGESWQTMDLPFINDAAVLEIPHIVYFGNNNETDASGHYKAWPAENVDKLVETRDATCTEAKTLVLESYITGEQHTETEGEALGHDFGEWTVTTEPTCTEKGEETRICSRCGEKETRNIEALGHTPGTPVKENVVNATCTEKGSYDTVVYCTVCSEELSREHTEVDALGHNWSEWTVTTEPTCTEKGVETRTCSRCGEIETREVAALGHDLIHHEAKTPTCTEIGWNAYDTCSRCDYTTYEELPALGHTPGAPVKENEVDATCTEKGGYDTVVYCSVCGVELSREHTEIPALGHDWSEWTVTKAATCTEKGEETRTCSRCDETETREIAALGHDLVHHDAKAPTCTEIGWDAYDTCSRCDYTTYEELPALGHTPGAPVKENEVDTTCTEKGGYDTVVYCTVCGVELSREHTEIPALGHDWSEWTVTKAATCTEKGVETRTCVRCGETETRVIEALGHTPGAPVKENVADATCTEKGGYDTVIYCTVCGVELSREHTETPALGHDWSEWTVTKAATCTEKGEETRTCSRCEEIETREVAALGHDLIHHEAKAPTCTEVGWNAYDTCSRCDYTTYEELPALGHDWSDWTVTTEPTCTEKGVETRTCSRCGETETREVAALGHDWSDWTVTTEPTCTEKGVETRTCSRCDETETREVAALGHDLVHHEAKAPTCTEAGWNAYDTCSRCDYTTYEELPALGHDWSDWTVTTEPTCTEKGVETRTCSRCGETETRVVAALGHDWSDWTVTTEPTCTEKGAETRTCSRCDETETREIEALGHDLVHHDAKAPTCTEIGWNAYDTCSRCDYTTYEELPALGHDWGEWVAVVTDTVCTKTRTCARCGETESFQIDLAELLQAIADAEAVDPDRYTEESVANLEAALTEAKAALELAESQEAIDAAAEALKNAIAQLEEKSSFLFDDVQDPQAYYFVPVYWAYYANPQITNGVDATHFGPEQACTRGHVVTFLWRAAGCPEPEGNEMPFTDVQSGAYYETAVAWAVEQGITKGTSATKFSPNETCTRGQIVTFLWRFKGEEEPASIQTPFTDVQSGAYYETAVAWAVEQGITKGTSETKFSPSATCTRGQVVTFLYRATAE